MIQAIQFTLGKTTRETLQKDVFGYLRMPSACVLLCLSESWSQRCWCEHSSVMTVAWWSENIQLKQEPLVQLENLVQPDADTKSKSGPPLPPISLLPSPPSSSLPLPSPPFSSCLSSPTFIFRVWPSENSLGCWSFLLPCPCVTMVTGFQAFRDSPLSAPPPNLTTWELGSQSALESGVLVGFREPNSGPHS